MKKFVIIILLLAANTAMADHITGGEMSYSFVGGSGGMMSYSGLLKLFMRCNSGRQFANPATISVFDRVSGLRIKDISVPLSSQQQISLSNTNPCITNPPIVCYEVGYYYFDVALPVSSAGYILASQVNFRISGINNLSPGYSNIGATYTAEIPGESSGLDAPTNSGANFVGNDLVIVCADNSFSYSFAADDINKDELRYSFCEAYRSSGGGGGGNNSPAPAPPYNAVPYNAGSFTGSMPLGSNVKIDQKTGLITGIAPSAGVYVVTVCVEEIRNGRVIATQRKDLQINIAPCTIAAATLLPTYMLCKDTKALNIANLSTSPLINTYAWEVVNASGSSLFSTTQTTLSYTFADTGTYTIKLVTNRGLTCPDSTTSKVRVYPGFKPGFNSAGICFTKPTKFNDLTTSVYGVPNYWDWDFGELSSLSDFSEEQHPVYTFPSMGVKSVRLITGNTVGCLDTVLKDVSIVDKPPVQLAFRDTLICIPDKLQLRAEGSGIYSWSPTAGMIDPLTSMPTVAPTVTTKYYVDLNDQGCLNRDSVLVRVVDRVTLEAMPDTLICRTDTIQLRVRSDGLKYAWSPALQCIDATVANPFVFTGAETKYVVRANIGSCAAEADVVVKTVPYPVADAGDDIMICFDSKGQLLGETDGTSVKWTPASTLSNPDILNPVASPKSTTIYTMFAYDTRGCPKPGIDVVEVKVLPDIVVSLTRDTTIVTGQPLQLVAGGGVDYLWTPSTNLSSYTIANPVALFNTEHPGLKYKVVVFNEAGCADSAFLTVKVYKTRPSIFVPTAFTPNGDSHNDILLPIAAGIQRFEYFNVYNRWGQLVFSSVDAKKGWDGKLNGQLQQQGTFVWSVKAVDYLGGSYFQKGIVVLLR